MVSAVLLGDAFACFLLTLGYVPVLRAYAVERASAWLVAGFSALLAGRLASLALHLDAPAVLGYVDHGVGVGLAGLCFAGHFLQAWQTDDDHVPPERTSITGEGGD